MRVAVLEVLVGCFLVTATVFCIWFISYEYGKKAQCDSFAGHRYSIDLGVCLELKTMSVK